MADATPAQARTEAKIGRDHHDSAQYEQLRPGAHRRGCSGATSIRARPHQGALAHDFRLDLYALGSDRALRGDKPLPESTIAYYLKNSPAFICETKKESFKKIDPKSGLQESDDSGAKKRTSTTAMVFYVSKTGLMIGAKDTAEGVINATAEGVINFPLGGVKPELPF